MRQLARRLTEEVAAHESGTAPKRFRVGAGIAFFPEGRCPFCEGPMKSRRIWRFNATTLKNWWKVVDGKLVLGYGDHPHTQEGTGKICHGKPALSSAAALFLGISAVNPWSEWSPLLKKAPKWIAWLDEVWGHTCPQAPELCEHCQHALPACSQDSADGWNCGRPVGHPLPHSVCVENGHRTTTWLCNCVPFEDWCGNRHPELDLVCSKLRHRGINHRACVVGQWDQPERHGLAEWRACVCAVPGTRKCRRTSDVGCTCTREPGHTGEHVACGEDRHRIDAWSGCCEPDPDRRCLDEDDGYECWRRSEHRGGHVACSEDAHLIHEWRCECQTRDTGCYAEDPARMWECNRERGHDGLHFACSGISHQIEEWEFEFQCDYCEEGGCSVDSPGDDWICSRESGHEGSHVACNGSDHEVESWDDPTACEYCEHGEDECGVSHSGRYECNRPEGHEGEHVACGDSHEVVTWEDEPDGDDEMELVVPELEPLPLSWGEPRRNVLPPANSELLQSFRTNTWSSLWSPSPRRALDLALEQLGVEELARLARDPETPEEPSEAELPF